MRLRKPNSEDKATESDANVAAPPPPLGPADVPTARIATNRFAATRNSPEDGQTTAVQDLTNQAPCNSTHQTQAVQDLTNLAPCSSTHQNQAVQDLTNQAPSSSTHQTHQDLTHLARITSEVQRGPGARPPISRVQDSDFGFSLDKTMCW